jgi:hypothetical protein
MIDDTCGDRVTLSVDQGTRTLATGDLANGAAAQFPSELDANVQAGDTISFMIDAGPQRGTDRSEICDTTQLAVTITAAS